MQYKCDFCHDSGSKNQTGEYLDCPACDMPMIRKALNDFVKSLVPTHPEDIALAIHQRALAMAPKQEVTSNNQLQKLKDAGKRAGMANHFIDGKLRDDMFVIGKDFIERLHAELEKLCFPVAAPAVANGALTDEQVHQGVMALLGCTSSEVEDYSAKLYEGYANDVRRVHAALAGAKGN